MRFFIQMTFIVAALALTSCSDGDSKGGGKKLGPQGKLTNKASGSFTPAVNASALPADPMSCPSEDSKTVYDPKLRAGQSFETEWGFLATNGEYAPGSHSTEKILSLNWNKNEASFHTTYYLDGFKGNYWTKSVCRYDLEKRGTDCKTVDYSAELKNIAKVQKGEEHYTENYCYVVSSNETDKILEDKKEFGEYQFADGRKVKAYRVAYSVTGNVFCYSGDGEGDAVEKGHGTELTVNIVSPEVPNIKDIMTCGAPADVYEYKEVKLDSGEVVSNKKFEIYGGNF